MVSVPLRLPTLALVVLLAAACSDGPALRTDGPAVWTLAGSGKAGFADGPATSAEFDQPKGVTALKNIIYIADWGNNRIREVNFPPPSQASVSTIAGTGAEGFVDGASAEFRGPYGIAAEASGDLVVADQGNNAIRIVRQNGDVTTLAGNGQAGLVDGASSSSEFNSPEGVAVDAKGDVYVADTGNNCIRLVNPAGMVTTLAGGNGAGYEDGATSSAKFSSPSGLALDGAGDVFVADQGNNRVREVNSNGQVSTVAGTGASGHIVGSGETAEFCGPTSIAGGTVPPSGIDFLVTEACGNRISEVSAFAGGRPQVADFAGNGNAGLVNDPASMAEFRGPLSIAMGPEILIADTGNNVIRYITEAY